MTVLPDRTMAGRSQKVLLPRRIQISGTRSSSMGTGRAAPLAAPSSAERSTIRRSYNFRADSLANISSPTCAAVGFVCWTLPTIRRVILPPKFPALVDLHVGPDGALYYLTRGGVFRIQATPSQAMNISTRARVEPGDNVLIGGFIVTGSAAKRVIVRAIGPSLSQHGVTDVLADTTLELHAGNGALLQSNDNWRDDPSQASQIIASGLAPSSNLESAIIATLQPGNYTAIVRGKNSRQGIALAEVYDLDPTADSELGNISGRSFVQTGDDVMIGGFIIGNNIGATKVIIRAIGPSLSQYGLSNVLADPTLELHDGNGALLESNDNWQDDPDQAARIRAANLAPSNPLESAIWVSLAPGNYTAIVQRKEQRSRHWSRRNLQLAVVAAV